MTLYVSPYMSTDSFPTTIAIARAMDARRPAAHILAESKMWNLWVDACMCCRGSGSSGGGGAVRWVCWCVVVVMVMVVVLSSRGMFDIPSHVPKLSQ